MRLAIGCDHAALPLKQVIYQYLFDQGLNAQDLGTYTEDSCDYPDIAQAVCEKVSTGEVERGILICGTGIGMSIAANKIKGIRAALCHDVYSARATRNHNDSNVLCMGARVIGSGLALCIVDAWLDEAFKGGRHLTRINKLENSD